MERQRTYNALYIIATFLLLTPFPDDVHTHARAYVINTHRLSPFILVAGSLPIPVSPNTYLM